MRIPLPIAVVAVVVVAGAAGVAVANRTDESDARWRLVRSDPTSNVVVIQSQHAGCHPFTRLSVTESTLDVRITVYQDEPPFWSTEGCDDIVFRTCHQVRLDRELGARKVTGPNQLTPDADGKLGDCR